MAKFVLAGKADCPYYAKAELLADALQLCLPNFTTRKICVLPDEWKGWLEATCATNGWKHDECPLVWRELVEQGGKGMLVGGFSDFLEHCQEYYSITSDMPTETMLSVSAENLETKMNFIKEEQHNSLISALHVWISGALNPTCHILIPNLSAEVFPHATAITLHMLEVEGDEEELKGLKMEAEDLALPLLRQVVIHTDLEPAFLEADVIILLDEWPDGKDTENEGEGEKKLKKTTERYREYGELINTRAKKEVRVIVAGDSLVNLKCSLLVEKVHFTDSHQFVTIATQLENVAKAILAKKLKVRASDIKDVIVWGNISGTFYIDLQRAKVFNYNGPIKGPPFFSQSVLKVFHDRKWLDTDFQDLVRCQCAAVASKLYQTAAMSAANGILTILKAWNGTCSPDDIFSLGVLCPGYYELPEGIMLSVPVTFKRGKWSVLLNVTVGDELKESLQLSAAEILQGKREDDVTISNE